MLFTAETAPFTPIWTEQEVGRYLMDNYRHLETLLDLGPYHHLLPTPMRRRTVVEQFDVMRFQTATQRIAVIAAPDLLRDKLWALVAEEMV